MLDSIDLIQPSTIDEARLQMVRDLHRAVHGDVWARPESPAEVWADLLARVSAASRAFAVRPYAPTGTTNGARTP
jgi:hypothetical protein